MSNDFTTWIITVCVTQLRLTIPQPDDSIVMKLYGIWDGVPFLIYDIARKFIRAENLTYSFATNRVARMDFRVFILGVGNTYNVDKSRSLIPFEKVKRWSISLNARSALNLTALFPIVCLPSIVIFANALRKYNRIMPDVTVWVPSCLRLNAISILDIWNSELYRWPYQR